ncbi:MAG: WecB/TagA/CpsF family glycosyltransferase [Treponema sp.]|nr:WecB/TagA/CpsF family glycosyltransferase [Treponema sp.]
MGAVDTQAYFPARERISLLQVPLDIVPPEQLPEVVYELLAPPEISQRDGAETSSPLIHPAPAPDPYGEGKNIVLLSLWDLLRARRNKEYRSFVLKASLVLPISKSLISGARFLTGKIPYRYMPFNFAVSLLSILERREYTAYLLGGRIKTLQKTEKNIRQTFPRLRIVGRFTGAFRKHEEPSILEAIRKAAPHLLLVGKGVRGEELWIGRNHSRLSRGLRLWCSDLFDVFAERKKRPSQGVFDRGLESLGYCLRSPVKFLRIFPYFRYKLLLLMYKIFRK